MWLCHSRSLRPDKILQFNLDLDRIDRTKIETNNIYQINSKGLMDPCLKCQLKFSAYSMCANHKMRILCGQENE